MAAPSAWLARGRRLEGGLRAQLGCGQGARAGCPVCCPRAAQGSRLPMGPSPSGASQTSSARQTWCAFYTLWHCWPGCRCLGPGCGGEKRAEPEGEQEGEGRAGRIVGGRTTAVCVLPQLSRWPASPGLPGLCPLCRAASPTAVRRLTAYCAPSPPSLPPRKCTPEGPLPAVPHRPPGPLLLQADLRAGPSAGHGQLGHGRHARPHRRAARAGGWAGAQRRCGAQTAVRAAP